MYRSHVAGACVVSIIPEMRVSFTELPSHQWELPALPSSLLLPVCPCDNYMLVTCCPGKNISRTAQFKVTSASFLMTPLYMKELGQEPSTHQALNDREIMNCGCSSAVLKVISLVISGKGFCFLLELHEINLCLTFNKELEFQKFHVSYEGIDWI